MIMVNKSTQCIIALSLLLLVLPITVNSLRLEKNKVMECPVNPSFLTKIDQFGFRTGGEFSVVGKPHAANYSMDAVILACNPIGYRALLSDPSYRERVCVSQIVPKECLLSLLDGTKSTHKIHHSDIYLFLIANCFKNEKNVYSPLKIGYKINALNPHHSQLPYGLEPLPLWYTVFIISFGCLCLLWALCLFIYRRSIRQIHKIFTGVLLAKLIIIILAVIFWKVYQRSGLKYNALLHAKGLTSTLFEAVFFCVLLLLSKGWGISRQFLPPQEFRSVSMPLFLLLFTLIFFSVYNDGYYMIAMMLMYFLMMPKIFASIAENVRLLRVHEWGLRNFGVGPISMESVQTKMQFFIRMRILTVTYVVLILISNCMRVFTSWHLEWVSIVIHELIAIAMLALLGFFIRPQLAHLSLSNGDVLLDLDELDDLPENLHLLPPFKLKSSMDLDAMTVVHWPNKKGLALCIKDKKGRKARSQ